MSSYDHLKVTHDGHVATVEIDRPPFNHVSVELMKDLADALETLDGDGKTRAGAAVHAAGRAEPVLRQRARPARR